MNQSVTYRQNAAECYEAARILSDPRQKAKLLAMAQSWISLADLERDEIWQNWGFPNQREFDSTSMLGRRPASMAKPLSSMDLRERAISRVEAGGSVRAVAASLSISPSCVLKWSQRFRATGSVAPGKMGGHKPRILQGAHADWLRERIPHSDFTLRGLVAELAERGLKVDYRSVWTFVHEEKLSFKKTVLQRARACRHRPQTGALEELSGADRSQTPRLHRRNLGQDQYGPAARLLQMREAAQRQGALWPLEDDDLPGRTSP